MKLNEFQDWIIERWGGELFDQRNFAIASLGLGGEAGEVGEALADLRKHVSRVQELSKKHIRDGKVLGEDLMLERGDVLHYTTVLASYAGFTLEDVAKANQTKLAKRDNRERA